MKQSVDFAKEHGYVTTKMGRIRALPEINSSNYNVRSFGERAALNMPLQGTAADIIKLAMINVYAALERENLSAKIILQVQRNSAPVIQSARKLCSFLSPFTKHHEQSF